LTKKHDRAFFERVRKGDRTRAAILDEAADLASLVGLTGLSVGSLASHSGMSKSGLFRHFGSKTALQTATLKEGVDRFVATAVRPALTAPRGEARVRALFERWLDWATTKGLAGGCLFIAASIELDDQPGPARDYLVATQRDWLDVIARTARFAVETGDFRPDLDAQQFAHEFNSILLGFHQASRLMRDPRAARRAEIHFNRLLADSRP
jgi:AcrR family transcriptional regulator